MDRSFKDVLAGFVAGVLTTIGALVLTEAAELYITKLMTTGPQVIAVAPAPPVQPPEYEPGGPAKYDMLDRVTGMIFNDVYNGNPYAEDRGLDQTVMPPLEDLVRQLPNYEPVRGNPNAEELRDAGGSEPEIRS